MNAKQTEIFETLAGWALDQDHDAKALGDERWMMDVFDFTAEDVEEALEAFRRLVEPKADSAKATGGAYHAPDCEDAG